MAAKFNHLVVLMLENRSFDHMLGRLYHHDNPDPYHIIPRGQSFDGVSDDMFNTAAGTATTNGSAMQFKAHRTTGFQTPVKYDIGHSFSNVQLQINGNASPNSKMQGFVASRISALKNSSHHVTATQAEMAEAMAGFSPTTHTATNAGPFAEARVINALARNFAVCDNWHASVPGPTFPNRSFLHAGTSNGFVANDPAAKWSQVQPPAPTIFNLLVNAGLSAKVYHSGDGTSSFPALVYELHPTINVHNVPEKSFHDFVCDAQGKPDSDGTPGKLPAYSFIEPRIIDNDASQVPDDQHPPLDIRLGEKLIQETYAAISTGPFWKDTLLVITYDEHGGFFDHRYPPTVPALSHQGGEDGFTFNQLGVRVPAVLVSPRIQAGTVFHPQTPVDHTSVIRTLCQRWNLPHLTARDAAACDLADVLGDTVRTDVPTVNPVNVSSTIGEEDLPLNDLQSDYIALVAANRAMTPPPMKTVSEARRFLATATKVAPRNLLRPAMS